MDTSSDKLLSSPQRQNGRLSNIDSAREDSEERTSAALEPIIVVSEDANKFPELSGLEEDHSVEGNDGTQPLVDDCTLITIPETSKEHLVSSSSPKLGRERAAKMISHEFGYSTDTVNSSSVVSAAGCLKRYQNKVLRITGSKCMLVFYFAFLAVPSTVGMIAARYMKECPMNPSIPLLIFMAGLAGALSIMFRILDLFQQWFVPCRTEWGFATVACFVGFFMTSLLIISEMLLIMQSEPSFDEDEKDFCHPTLYYFAYWMNWIGVLTIGLIIIIHGPSLINVESL